MKRCAGGLSVAGFILAAYFVLGQAPLYWHIWQREQEIGAENWPHWLWIAIGIGVAGILRLVVTSVLLRRLARPAPAGPAVRWLARFWTIPTLCMVGLSFWGYWELLSRRDYPAIFLSAPYRQSLQWAFALVSLSFSLGSVRLFWGLTRERRPPALGASEAAGVASPGRSIMPEDEERDPPETELSSVRKVVERTVVWGFFIITGLAFVQRLTTLVVDR